MDYSSIDKKIALQNCQKYVSTHNQGLVATAMVSVGMYGKKTTEVEHQLISTESQNKKWDDWVDLCRRVCIETPNP